VPPEEQNLLPQRSDQLSQRIARAGIRPKDVKHPGLKEVQCHLIIDLHQHSASVDERQPEKLCLAWLDCREPSLQRAHQTHCVICEIDVTTRPSPSRSTALKSSIGVDSSDILRGSNKKKPEWKLSANAEWVHAHIAAILNASTRTGHAVCGGTESICV
jgi:hypothetical protein